MCSLDCLSDWCKSSCMAVCDSTVKGRGARGDECRSCLLGWLQWVKDIPSKWSYLWAQRERQNPWGAEVKLCCCRGVPCLAMKHKNTRCLQWGWFSEMCHSPCRLPQTFPCLTATCPWVCIALDPGDWHWNSQLEQSKMLQVHRKVLTALCQFTDPIMFWTVGGYTWNQPKILADFPVTPSLTPQPGLHF